jgi:hypothetical protein
MTLKALPDEVRRFILTSVPSVPYLEAILLLRSEAQAQWDAARVSSRLYIAEARAAELLEQLAAAGVAQRMEAPGACYRYQPGTAELAARLDMLAAVYANNLVVVTDLIHSRIDKRAQQFADAFRLRKDS